MKNNKCIIIPALLGSLTFFLPAVAYYYTLNNKTNNDVTFQLSSPCSPILSSKKTVVKAHRTGTVYSDSDSCCASTMNVRVGDQMLSEHLSEAAHCSYHNLVLFLGTDLKIHLGDAMDYIALGYV